MINTRLRKLLNWKSGKALRLGSLILLLTSVLVFVSFAQLQPQPQPRRRQGKASPPKEIMSTDARRGTEVFTKKDNSTFRPEKTGEEIVFGSKTVDIATSDVFQNLLSKVRVDGTVRVIVGVRAAYTPEAQLIDRRDVESQRTSINAVQDSVLSTLAGVNPDSIIKYYFIPAMALEVDETALQILGVSSDIVSIQEDHDNQVFLAESVPLIGGTAAWASGFTGAGQTVAILDTGVDKTHPFLANKVVSEACYSTNLCPGGVRSSTASGSGLNCDVSLEGCEHGTHVAGIAAGKGTSFSGVAKDANIIAIKVFSADASGKIGASDNDIISGLQRVSDLSTTFSIASVNMSLGSGQFPTNCDSINSSMKAAIDALRAKGIATVIATGNKGLASAISYPACISSAISVGSTDDGSSFNFSFTVTDAVSEFSNSAPIMKLLAPGRWITSSVPGGGVDTFMGTSMAAPHVAGAWALLKSKSNSASVDQVLSALTNTGHPITDPRNGLVKPRIQVDSALNALGGGNSLPDLVVSSLSSASTGIIGGQLTNVSIGLTNQGTGASGVFKAEFYLSTDSTITTSDIDTGWSCTITPGLGAGATTTCGGSIGIPSGVSPGNYFFGAIVDPANVISESNESNNTRVSGLISVSSGSVFSLGVGKNGSGTGTVTSNPLGISCGTSCSNAFNNGTVVTLTATSDNGSVFAGWGGDCNGSGSSPTCTVTMNSAKSVTATFNLLLPDFNVTALSSASTGVSGGQLTNLSVTVSNLASSTSTAFAAEFYISLDSTITKTDIDTGWECSFESGLASGASSVCSGSIVIPSSVAPGTYFLGAIVDPDNSIPESNENNNARSFGPITILNPTFNLTVSKTGTGSGTVSSSPAGINCGITCSGDFSAGTPVTLTASAVSGSTFVGWSGACSGSICTVTMDSSKSVIANFAAAPPDLTITALSSATSGIIGGQLTNVSVTVFNQGNLAASAFALEFYLSTDSTITTSDVDTTWGCSFPSGLAAGATSTCTGSIGVPATISPGNYFLGAIVDPSNQVAESNESNNTRSFGPITAVVGSSSLSVVKAGSGAGTITSSPAGVNCGSTCSFNFTLNTPVTLTASPSGGSVFAGWSGGCSGTGSCVLTMDSSKSVTATFNSSGKKARNDYDGDGKSDFAVWRASNGTWFVINSSNGQIQSRQWGSQSLGDVPAPGDYDGDGKTDFAVWRASTGVWYVIRSSDTQIVQQQWGSGALGDVPVPGDYDGDGKADFAVWRASTGTWFVIKSSTGQVVQQQWGSGALGDVPVPGDYDGDGKVDFAVWRASTGTWFVIKSSTGQSVQQQWGSGALGDIPVVGDYDGDGKADYAVWRASNGIWFVIKSSTGQTVQQQWGSGALGDIPIAGDYDGDGKSDFTVWRASTGTWFVINSSNGQTQSRQWGSSGLGDLPMGGRNSNSSPSGDEEPESGSAGVVTLSGVSLTAFNPLSSALKFNISQASFSTVSGSVHVLVNGVIVPDNKIVTSTSLVTVNSSLVAGQNIVSLVAQDQQNMLISFDATVWAGSNSLTVTVTDQNNQPIAGAVVTARLGDDQSVTSSATTSAGGVVTFSNLPDRTIILEATASGNRYASIAVTGSAGSVKYKLNGFGTTSGVDNNDFTQGLSGWTIGNAPVTLIPHDEGSGSSSQNDINISSDTDLQLATSGEGPQTISRTFQTKPNTKNVSIRYRFVTLEFPTYLGTKYNDYFNVSIRSKNGGGLITESNSMNGLGGGAFDSQGRTSWRELSLPVSAQGDVIQIDLTVANVGDGAFDSYLIVDIVNEKKLAITASKLYDIDDTELQFLSVDQHTYYGGITPIHGTVTVEGAPGDKLTSLILEITEHGRTVATADVVQSAQNSLYTVFDSTGKIRITVPTPMYEIPSARFIQGGVDLLNDGLVGYILTATSQSGEKFKYTGTLFMKLVRYTQNNRYPANRDVADCIGVNPPYPCGGDDWVVPSIKKIAEYFGQMNISYNDFSNMHGGKFPVHSLHRIGRDIDAFFPGYNARDKSVAEKLVALMNDQTNGSKISQIYVTFTPAFSSALDNLMVRGMPAKNFIIDVEDHDTHFHLRFF